MSEDEEAAVDASLECGPWRRDHIWVSHLNYLAEMEETRARPAEVIIHDSTLRDGEQAAGVSFDVDGKLTIARLLDDVGVQYVEAGFPAVSAQDRESIQAISGLGLRAKITCLSRAIPRDIDLAADCGVWGIVLEVPVGYPKLRYQFGWPEQRVIDRVLECVHYAKTEKGLGVILFLIDTCRARVSFLERLLKTSEQTGCIDRITIVDTVGACVPEAIAWLTGRVRGWVDTPLEIHCHNDMGLGVANTIAGLMAGASVASTTIGGLGMRAGNTSTEEVAVALNVAYGVPFTARWWVMTSSNGPRGSRWLPC